MKKQDSGSKPKLSAKDTVAASPALKELFKDGISDLYWAENHLVKNLPKMISSATSPVLKGAIESHLTETKGHVARLEKVFELLGEKPIAKKCDAMEGLSKEGESIIEETEAGTATRDVGIILASQKVEHYEIASYSGLFQLATTLGLTEIADLLEQTLAEEKLADVKLNDIAQNEINYKAAEEA
ncbi:YciE/YciF ferroxidase family protein [Pedobacter alluvionis]|uniref:Ferritin-like domain-containing protein n=1 Tax=Pedobacter alluvionis TaxID=475253 RepID=A0A497Y773_9SPHI|nr:ferritin-like domain-containing protein [Pedobacter alluvionis]RLJ76808.1 ferritin-like metal-binding protein YciE [Pedobacter alluvionis]TFB33926.1 ferritin-like domain-containing protein [Pedobacter alluvionis]